MGPLQTFSKDLSVGKKSEEQARCASEAHAYRDHGTIAANQTHTKCLSTPQGLTSAHRGCGH